MMIGVPVDPVTYEQLMQVDQELSAHFCPSFRFILSGAIGAVVAKFGIARARALLLRLADILADAAQDQTTTEENGSS